MGRNVNQFEAPKPMKDGKGSTIQINYSQDNDALFLVFAKQIPTTNVANARFDYDHKLTIKLSALDLCEFINVIEGKPNSMGDGKGLYHEFTSGGVRSVTIITFKKNDNNYAGYYLKAMRKTDDKTVNYGIRITENEALIMKTLFLDIIPKLYNWGISKDAAQKLFKKGK